MKGSIQSVEVTYLIHATEDPGKLDDAVAQVLSVDSEPQVEKLEGHFGNDILRARLHLTGVEATKAFGSIIRQLPLNLRNRLVDDVGSFLDEHSAFFLRFDKQLLVSGSLALGSSDSVRVKVKPRAFQVRGNAPEFFANLIRGA